MVFLIHIELTDDSVLKDGALSLERRLGSLDLGLGALELDLDSLAITSWRHINASTRGLPDLVEGHAALPDQ